ncbi:MAG: low specificity L-threonine aldolase [Hyphomicrobiaceae bacterium]
MADQFASDNNAGMCPAALAALTAANADGHAAAYGEDPWTERACGLIRDLFEAPQASVHFVFNGTAANALALAQLCRPYHAIIAHGAAHIATDEAGAPGFFSGGGWLCTADPPGAKLTPPVVERLAGAGRGVHHNRPRVLSLSQATELGTVYSVAEVAALTAAARAARLAVHMDGARFANAVARQDCSPADLSWRAGVDVLSFGGVKNGLAAGEAVIFFDPVLACEFEWRVKQAGHLNAKMRLVTAPWCALLSNDVWLDNARHANAMARRLADRIGTEAGLPIVYPVEANAVFVEMPTVLQVAVRARGWRFYTFEGETVCRLMCAWDTRPETVDRFVDDIASAM